MHSSDHMEPQLETNCSDPKVNLVILLNQIRAKKRGKCWWNIFWYAQSVLHLERCISMFFMRIVLVLLQAFCTFFTCLWCFWLEAELLHDACLTRSAPILIKFVGLKTSNCQTKTLFSNMPHDITHPGAAAPVPEVSWACWICCCVIEASCHFMMAAE